MGRNNAIRFKAYTRKGFDIMNDQQLEKKVRQDAAKIKKDLSTLLGDSTARIKRFEDDVAQSTSNAKLDLTTKVEDNISQIGEGFEKLTDDAKKTVVGAAVNVKKDVGRGLSDYNSKVQKVADKVPGDINKKAGKYPWVAVTIALVVGFLVASLIKPSRHTLM
jgi:ElaB/YqjD/DUF883 family membrane-anchored ribosome-binding protein